MLLSNLSFLLPLFHLLPFGLATEQKTLKGAKASPFTAEFKKLVAKTLEKWHVPGIAIGVIDGDKEWSEGFGFATLPDKKVTPSTLFYAGSTTKAFTASVMSLLVDDNANFSQVQWDTPISKLIPEDFVLSDAYATSHITVEDSLSHRSGLPRHDFAYGGNYKDEKASVKGVVRAMRYLPLTAEPRTKFQYCNQMYVTASHVIETLTGRWLGDILKEKIWEPLNMKSTYFSTQDAINGPEDLAQGYVYYKDKYQKATEVDFTAISGAGSIVTNVLDYSKWLKAQLSKSGPISKEGYKALRTPRIAATYDSEPRPFTGTEAYALGWSTGVYKGYEWFEHGGGTISMGTELIFFPALNYGVVMFGNTAGTANFVESVLLWNLVDEKLNIPKEERFDFNDKYEKQLKKQGVEYKNAQEAAYPKIPNPPLPTTLPLQNYTGTYYNPAYNNLTIAINNNTLYASRLDATWKLEINFEHVSGDYFMAYADSTESPGRMFNTAAPAEFKVASDGVAKYFGLAAEPEMGLDGRIWFERV